VPPRAGRFPSGPDRLEVERRVSEGDAVDLIAMGAARGRDATAT